jgi:hemolysin activation/secretion protein
MRSVRLQSTNTLKQGHTMLKLIHCTRLLLTLATAAVAVLPALAEPQTHTGASNGSQQIVPSLKGLVFIARPEDLVKEGVSTPGVNAADLKILDAAGFKEQMAAYLGSPLTLDGLNEITHGVVTYYRKHSHPLVDAVAPAQNVESGVVQILVTEFRVGTVRPEGNKWFSDRIVTSPITLHHGDTIDSTRLINQLDAANTNPFRRVNLVYQPASQQGYTDLVLQTQDRLPLRISTGFDNSGTPVTGRNRWEFGATWGNALWHDQQLSYQFSSSTDFFGGRNSAPGEPGGASFVGNSLNWSMPVRGRDSISIFGSYERSVPNLGQDFGLVGLSGQASIRYSLGLHRTGSLIHTLQVGYDFKTTNNNLDFGGTQVSRTNAEIDQLPLIYAANLTDKRGSSALTTSVNFSPGNVTGNNTNAAFQPATGQSGRELASARYVYWRSDATRLTKLPVGAVWALRVMGQTSTSNLLYTEQLAGGGPEILRGYDPNAVLGDQGVVVSNELRSPAFHKQGEGARFGQIQVLSFWDWAHLSSAHDVEGAINHISASSIGMGLRYNLRSNVTAKFDYGWQLQHLPTAGNRDHLVNFALMTSY